MHIHITFSSNYSKYIYLSDTPKILKIKIELLKRNKII